MLFSLSESIENSVHDEKFGRIFFVVLNVFGKLQYINQTETTTKWASSLQTVAKLAGRLPETKQKEPEEAKAYFAAS